MKNNINRANPIELSLAATVRINIENICPNKSSKNTEKYMKFKLILIKTIYIHNNIIKIFCLFRIIPKIPKQNKVKLNKIILNKNIILIIYIEYIYSLSIFEIK